MASRTRAGYGGEDARWLRGRESGARGSPVRRLRGRSGMLFSWSVSYRAGASGPLFGRLPCGVLGTFPQNGHLAYARGRDTSPPGGCARSDAPLRCPGDREPRPRNRRPTDDGARDGGRLAEICLEGKRWRTDGPPLSELLAVIDETQQRLREGGLSE